MFCKTCQQEKDSSCFYNSDKHHCKDCKKAYAKKYREDNIERILVYDRNRVNAKERVQKQKEYKERLRIENPEKYDEIYHSLRKRYRAKYKEKAHAENLLNDAIRTGKIIRPNKCIVCQKECKPQAHHYDYSKPLDVMWLCVRCHANVHKNERAKKGWKE